MTCEVVFPSLLCLTGLKWELNLTLFFFFNFDAEVSGQGIYS